MLVTDNAGANSSSSLTVSVSVVGGGNSPPSASFTSDCPDLSCDFDASASSDSDGNITGYGWDFGDGVVLTVSDNGSADSTSTQTLFVTNGNSSPSAVFSQNCTDLDCNFDASSSFDTDGNLVSYDWNFGDGTNGTGVTTNHNYSTGGDYSVMLTVTDDAGGSSNSAQSVTVSKAITLDGQALFNDNCSTCHGTDAQGGALAPAIVGRTASDIQNAINTVNQMKSLSSLTNEEVQAISDYLGTL
jgi:PKD repeat protein